MEIIRPGLGGLQDEAVWTDRLDSLIGLSETAQKSVLDVSLRELFGAARENDGENAVPTDRTN